MKDLSKNKLGNRLRIARKRRGLDQKQVAYLLGHSSVDQISRYENKSRNPRLELAFKLEIIFGVPLRVLYPELHDHLRSEIGQRIETNKLLKELPLDGLRDHRCSYRELLTFPTPSKDDLEKVRDHATELSQRLAELWGRHSQNDAG